MNKFQACYKNAILVISPGNTLFKRSAPNPHRPLHIYADNTYYFVTGSTLHRAHLLTPATHKPYLKERLFDLASDYELNIEAWVLLNNHYHVLFYLSHSNKLNRFSKHLHGQTSTDFNKWENQSGRQFWYNYWDWCIRDERDYWQHFNYIHYNPVKHGYVQKLRDWPFSSLFSYLEEKGREWLDDCWRSYPIREFEIEDDNF